MKFVNIEVLEEFINDKHKNECDMEVVKEEVIESAMNGNSSYELGSYETKSGHAELIFFEHTDNIITF